MKPLVSGICAVILLLFFAPASADRNDGVVEELLSLLSKGECAPSSLTRGVWTINTPPMGTHGELVLGDYLVFELLDDGVGERQELLAYGLDGIHEAPTGGSGAPARTYGLPRFQEARFEARFPFAQVHLRDPELPLDVSITKRQAWLRLTASILANCMKP